jgi:hypothetical protein
MIWALRNWRIIAAVGFMAGLFYAGWHVRGNVERADDLRAAVALKTAQIAVQAKAIKIAEEKAHAYEIQREIVAADLAVTDGVLNSLRADLANIGKGSNPSSPDAARVAGILGECADEVVRLASAADSLAAKVTALQAYVRD